jgi:hypothetical protein
MHAVDQLDDELFGGSCEKIRRFSLKNQFIKDEVVYHKSITQIYEINSFLILLLIINF